MEKLSIIIPLFNEEKTISLLLEKIRKIKFSVETEIIIVDDGSTDSSLEKAREFAKKNRNVSVFGKKNSGKGSAVKIGLEKAKGTIIIVQDADLEYNPEEIPKVIAPILDGKADVVFGSRFKGKIIGRQIWSHYFGNKLLSFATAVLFFHNISDMETCYKAFRRSVIEGMKISSNKFDVEPEITAKILKRKYKMLEFPITYNARTFEEGKKIKISDGIIALKTLLKYRFSD